MLEPYPENRASGPISRRGLFHTVAGMSATLMATTTGNDTWGAEPVHGAVSPKEALHLLYAGNQRFAEGHVMAPHRNMQRLKEVAPQQTPFAAFLGCADSRVPIEIIFDQGFGDLFVTRIAGNVASSENIGSLEFGTRILGAKVLYVLGHTACGAVTATMKRQPVPGQISSLFQHIRPAVKIAGDNLDLAVRENVRLQAMTLAEASPVIAELVEQGQLIVAGGVYDLTTGLVTPVELSPDQLHSK